MLLRKKTKSLIVVSLAIIGLASTSIVNARSLIASNTSLVQIESKGTHPTGSVTKGNYTVNSSILTKPSMGQAAARGILTVGSPKPAKDMGLSMTLWGTEYSLIAATPYYYNTNGTTAVSVTTRYADGYSTFTTGGDMKYNNLSSNWRFKQAKWISPYNKNSDKLVENVFENYKDILKNFYLNINAGEVHALMGPNGTGKSTLSKVILNNKKYQKLSGKIIFDDVDITNMSTDEIARKGIFLCNQLPCEIDGVTTADFLRTALNEKEEVSLYQYIKKIDSAVKDLKMDENMIHRSMNKGFSGGEKKKNEILQLKVLEPKFIILDELDSGLDVDSLKIVCENINSYLKEHENTSVLIITHYPKILQYIKPDYVHVMVNGNIKKTGDASLALEIEEKGYDAYKNSASIVSE